MAKMQTSVKSLRFILCLIKLQTEWYYFLSLLIFIHLFFLYYDDTFTHFKLYLCSFFSDIVKCPFENQLLLVRVK